MVAFDLIRQVFCKHDWVEHCVIKEGRVMLCKKCFKDHTVIDNWR